MTWEERAVWALLVVGAYVYACLVDRAQKRNARHAKTLAQELHRLNHSAIEGLRDDVDMADALIENHGDAIRRMHRANERMASGVRKVVEACGALEQAGEANA